MQQLQSTAHAIDRRNNVFCGLNYNAAPVSSPEMRLRRPVTACTSSRRRLGADVGKMLHTAPTLGTWPGCALTVSHKVAFIPIGS